MKKKRTIRTYDSYVRTGFSSNSLALCRSSCFSCFQLICHIVLKEGKEREEKESNPLYCHNRSQNKVDRDSQHWRELSVDTVLTHHTGNKILLLGG